MWATKHRPMRRCAPGVACSADRIFRRQASQPTGFQNRANLYLRRIFITGRWKIRQQAFAL
ncbi:hypothetical protein RSSM_05896 [Rhodopirellula sallentina SM41]|uniref:Uncharacterized protein n=1 Tax=Rhodopirellula sallentina SM41 TaxID=1263870 RepID=M5TUE7_9BACT|nr:hypothetical protein RSSM_05896 [Rhodopirellula sallentina SM41]